MKRFTRQIALGFSLVVISTLLYVEQIKIFHAPRDTFFYLFQDLAFVPIQVLLVTVIVDRVLRAKEADQRQRVRARIVCPINTPVKPPTNRQLRAGTRL